MIFILNLAAILFLFFRFMLIGITSFVTELSISQSMNLCARHMYMRYYVTVAYVFNLVAIFLCSFLCMSIASTPFVIVS